ncbi:heparinase II/III domain-containing protein [Schleiferilactobacillus perolens]|uniref:Heparinase II/III-like C-terminal domain-containing protein n=1 Tax=Schleiferilactobacillus perolens DSM 12744 TaxID=1423792 RepID=A0A0R1N640_9LACO|nr:heparinase II/III family protein [Schleiferilactobacillus perolens]KRL13780.1 hypothetical protein FD09_GL001808 [Schleiferilactobacillus perolens DSM 12744]
MDTYQVLSGMRNPLADHIRQEAARLPDQLPPLTWSDFARFMATGDRQHYEDVYFSRRQTLALQGAAWYLAPTAENAAALAETLWQIGGEPTWALPAHIFKPGEQIRQNGDIAEFLDLFACETAQAVAQLLHDAGAHLPAILVAFLQHELDRRIFTPFLDHDWQWLYLHNNWAAVCGGSVGMAALATLPATAPRRQAILAKVDIALQNFLQGFGNDGATEEGVSYWAYGFGYYVYFATAYQAATGDARYLQGAKIAAIAQFPFAASVYPDQYVMFGDVPDRQTDIPSGLLSFCHQQWQAPLAAPVTFTGVDENGRFAPLLHNLLWTDPAFQPTPLPPVTHLPSVAWTIRRQNGWCLTCKGGSNNVSHNHNDVGTFEIIEPDQTIITELGSGLYTKQYFDDTTRYHILETRSLGHSVPFINGCEQYYGDESMGRLTHTTDFDRIEMTAVYSAKSHLTKLTRTFQVSPAGVTITDDAAFNQPANSFEEILILPHEPIIHGHTIQLGDWQLTTTLGGDFSVDTLESFHHTGDRYHVYRLRIHYQLGSDGVIVLHLDRQTDIE